MEDVVNGILNMMDGQETILNDPRIRIAVLSENGWVVIEAFHFV